MTMFRRFASPTLAARHTEPAPAQVTRPTALLVAIGIAAALSSALCAGPTTSVVWENLQGSDTPSEAAFFDADGITPLSAGSEEAGDGAVVALGYFTGANTAAGFAGEWVPLTGLQAANIPFQKTTLGDASSGGTLPHGFFSFQTDFDSSDSARYQRMPPPGTRLAIAIYNRSTIGGSSHFNIVTHDAWVWEEPGPILPTFLFLNPSTPGTVWFGGASTAMRTTVATSHFPGNAARAPARLINISTRAVVGTGSEQMIPGFVLQGAGTTRLLVRAVGATLTSKYGVPGTLSDPLLRIVRQSDSVDLGSNDDWSAQSAEAAALDAAFRATSAFSLPQGSTDAALLVDLPASQGGYTVQVNGKDGATGVALAEVYLVDDAPDAAIELVNISTRGFVGTGSEIMIAGFVVGPGGPRRLLVRAAGPTLSQRWGVPGTLVDPQLRVVPSAAPDEVLAQNDTWSADGQAAAIRAAESQVSAFKLLEGSADAALLLQLPAADRDRGYTVQVSGGNGGTGVVITEIYELP